jgi:hypothetical protein
MQNVDKSIISNTYTISDFLYRFSLIRRFIEKIEYTSDLNNLSFEDKVKKFLKEEEVDEYHSESFKQWNEEIFDTLRSGDFYKNLDDLFNHIEHERFLTLTVPVRLDHEKQKEISLWVREKIDHDVLIKLRIDEKLIAGCLFTWSNQQYDYTFRKLRFEKHEKITESVKNILTESVL